jgi:hypothetical protein
MKLIKFQSSPVSTNRSFFNIEVGNYEFKEELNHKFKYLDGYLLEKRKDFLRNSGTDKPHLKLEERVAQNNMQIMKVYK